VINASRVADQCRRGDNGLGNSSSPVSPLAGELELAFCPRFQRLEPCVQGCEPGLDGIHHRVARPLGMLLESINNTVQLVGDGLAYGSQCDFVALRLFGPPGLESSAQLG
jgi:hypothetical protein